MPLLTIANLAHSIGTHPVLDGVSFSIEPGEKIGLVGRNGSGKTTLLRAIAGEFRPDSGDIQIGRGTRIGHLRQDPVFETDETLFGAAEAAFAELHDIHAALDAAAAAMAQSQGDETQRLLKKYERLESDMLRLGGYVVDHRIEEMLHGLGFVDQQFKLPVNVLSGGQKSRLALARLLLENPDLLLLDEPTNHLDIDGRRWLEGFLADEFRGAALIVSHDRYLLDRVVSRIVEIDAGGSLRTYPGNYEKYRELRKERMLAEQRVFDKQRDFVRSEQRYIDRYRAGQRARQAAGREKRLDRFRDLMADRPIELDVMHLELPAAPRSGDIVSSAEDVSKRYDGKPLFANLTISVPRGGRVGVIGPNGSGKTTLARCLLGEVPIDSGKVRLGSNVHVGFYRQSHEHLDGSLRVWQYLQSVIAAPAGQPRAGEQQARDLAGAFLFSGDDQEKVLANLSGGERSRAVLAGLVSGGHNLLVLDEPTNHFDIPSAERLEEALRPENGYDGTLLLISHDRALLDALVDQLIILDGQGGSRVFTGNYSRWRESVDAKSRSGKTPPTRRPPPADAAPSRDRRQREPGRKKNPPTPVGALSNLSQEKLEAKIEKIQTRIRKIDDLFLDPDVQRDGKKVRALSDERAALGVELEPLEFEWSRRADDVEKPA